ncbi:alpha/beta hydrolase [Mycobacterium paraterrae]|uniref:Alpha/beta hydrolase n=1 Tax=Mycobacterium paraterrae TaxID=577492 RepID=A0ABY3VRN5_9MYCO|nr:alpha/beta hydrolase [Mycobacterium paraterrae]UMB72106.1 alpha/beta hydrolase [Mycobacterium paraterrae]
MSALVAEVPDPRAVIVAIHGGGTTALYFDCPGHPDLSLLRGGAQHGFTVVAIDRPGYGSSAAYPDAVAEPKQRIRLTYGVVDKVLGERPRGAGLFLMAHSGGCELAIRMAAEGSDEQRAGLIGMELAGTGRRYHPAAREILKTATREHRPSGMRELLWHPPELYPAEMLRGATVYPGAPPYEDKMVSNWARQDFPSLAPNVRIPVQFSIAEHEKVWQCDADAQAEIASLFTQAPRFEINEQAGAGHNISVGHTAAAYHSTVFAFADQCVNTVGTH